MDNFEMTKIAGAVLAALLVIFGTKTFIEIASESAPEKPGYTLPEPSKAAEGSAAPAGAEGAAKTEAGAADLDIAPLLAKANPDNGKTTFNKCKSCHATEKGKNGVGPTLYGVVDRPKASVDGFKYSDALKTKGGAWSFQELSKFLVNPKADVPGTKMTFAGLPSAADRADLIAYLASIGDTPAKLPK